MKPKPENRYSSLLLLRSISPTHQIWSNSMITKLQMVPSFTGGIPFILSNSWSPHKTTRADEAVIRIYPFWLRIDCQMSLGRTKPSLSNLFISLLGSQANHIPKTSLNKIPLKSLKEGCGGICLLGSELVYFEIESLIVYLPQSVSIL